METFRIDFTLSNPFPDGKKLGECGEKNAAQLIITPPENLASREEIRSYVVAFSTEKGPVRYGPVPKSETVTVPVCNALTVGTALSVQVEGYDADGEFVIKSPVLSGITVSNSISLGSRDDEETVIPGHTHGNLEYLNCFKEINGLLLYKNRIISDGSENHASPMELSFSKGSFSVFSDSPFSNCLTFVAGKKSDGELFVPEGLVIRSIEMNFSDPQNPVWIDLRDMNDSQLFVPYLINMYKSVYSEVYNGTILACVYFPFDTTNLYHAAANYEINSIRVVYEESGDK
ncbi:MAG: hypothetical protein IKJ41_04885 [Clostridia bacterium]|nr:hypothetical protein [Clostridia bacterium]